MPIFPDHLRVLKQAEHDASEAQFAAHKVRVGLPLSAPIDERIAADVSYSRAMLALLRARDVYQAALDQFIAGEKMA